MEKWIKNNWFKLGVLFFLFSLIPVLFYIKSNRYSFRKIQDAEILSVVPEGYRIAQVDQRKNEVNYIQAHLENIPDDEVIVLLEYKMPQIVIGAVHPPMAKILKYNHESDKWQEIKKMTFGDDTNIGFSYAIINIEGDKTDKVILFPYFVSLDDMNFDVKGSPVSIKENPTKHQTICVLGMKNGLTEDKMGYGFRSPRFSNITQAGGSESVMINNSLIVGEYAAGGAKSWAGCNPIHYKRYVYKKHGGILKGGGFDLYDEFTTAKKYTQSTEDKSCGTWIIYAGSTALEEPWPKSFQELPKGEDVLMIKEKK